MHISCLLGHPRTQWLRVSFLHLVQYFSACAEFVLRTLRNRHPSHGTLAMARSGANHYSARSIPGISLSYLRN